MMATALAFAAGVWIAGMGLLALVAPVWFFDWVDRLKLPERLPWLAGIRAGLAVVFWLSADHAAHPTVFRGLAVLTAIGAIAVLGMGRERVGALVAWWQRQNAAVVRGWGVVATALGVYVVWALMR